MDKIEKKENILNKKEENDIFIKNEIKNLDSTLNQNKNIFDINNKTLQDDLKYFKNDILKDIKNTENKLNQKFDIQNNGFENRLEEMEKKSNILNQKFSILNEAISNQNIIKERISILELFRLKADESLITYDCKFKNLDKEFHEAVIKYDKIILDSIVYPGVIGKTNQFKTFHDLIDFLLLNINRIINAKERETTEFNESKNKLEELSKNFQGKIDFYLNNVNEFTRKIIKHSEMEINEKIDNLIKEFSDNKMDFIQKFNKYERKIDELTNNVMNLIEENSNELKIKIAEEKIDLNSKMKLYDIKYDEYSNKFDLMKQEIQNLNSMLGDLLLKIDKIDLNSQKFNKNNNNNSINANNNNISFKNNNFENSRNDNIGKPKIKIENIKNNIYENNVNNNNFNKKNDIDTIFKNNNNAFINNYYNIEKEKKNINKRNKKNIKNKEKEKENGLINNYLYEFNANNIIKKYIERLNNVDDINHYYLNKSPNSSSSLINPIISKKNEYNNKQLANKLKYNEEEDLKENKFKSNEKWKC